MNSVCLTVELTIDGELSYWTSVCAMLLDNQNKVSQHGMQPLRLRPAVHTGAMLGSFNSCHYSSTHK